MIRRDAAGFTVVELSITCALLSVVLISLLSLLDSQTRAERHLHAVINSQEDVRFAMLAMARDVRAADPVLALTNVADYGNQIQVQLRDGSGASLGYVRWLLDGAAQSVSRQMLSGPNGTVTTTVFTLPRVRNAQDGLPLFRYYNSDGTELTAATATPADVANCTVRVHISVKADTNPGPKPFLLDSDAEVRNRLPGGIGC
jgi:type II secretory pathway pseudopilin PulG